MVDMKVFLAEKDGVKLATKQHFWKVATPEMWAIDPKLIWEFLRKNGWIQKDINAASTARCNQTPEIKAQKQAQRQEKEKAFQQAVAGKDMKVFLAVDENGVKLATKAQFWKEATPEMRAVEPKFIWDFMRKNGWIQKDIDAATKARRNQTPEVKARKAAREKTPETKAKRAAREKTPETKAKIKAWQQKPEVKARAKAWQQKPEVKARAKARRKARQQKPEVKARDNSRRRERCKTDPEFKLAIILRTNFKRIKKLLIEAKVMTEEEVKHFKQNCKDNDSYYAQHFRHYLEKTLPDGVTWEDWATKKVNLEIDHVFPLMPAINNSKLFPGLLEFVQSPVNAMFLDGATNISKHDKIILELIPQNCPGYPFTGIDAEVFTTIEEAGLPRAPFEKWLEIKKILETL